MESGMERSLRSKDISHTVLLSYQSTSTPYKAVDADKGNISYYICDDDNSDGDPLYNDADSCT
jgi:hypothetical protein